MGILFAFGALLSWGIGDFLIQRSTRELGSWTTLFSLTAFGAIVLFPFVYPDLGPLLGDHSGLLILGLASIILLYAAIFDMRALRSGKLSVVEPVFAAEVIITTGLAAFFLREFPTGWQWLFILISLSGVALVSTKSLKFISELKDTSRHLEKGVLLAILATLGMGTANFMFGLGSRAVSPLVINWFTDTFIAIIMGLYLWQRGDFKRTGHALLNHKTLALSMSAIDKAAWLFYSYSMTLIPIAVATSISESYIALAALLGLRINNERLKPHQLVGITLAVIGAIALSAVTS